MNGNYSRKIRKQYNQLYSNSMGKLQSLKIAEGFINKKTLYPVLNNIIYGWLKPKLDEIEKIRLSIWCPYYGMDASEKTIPLKFAPQQRQNIKLKMNASCNHICCEWGYHIGYTRLLEKAGERYEVMLVKQLAATISNNMSLVKKCDDFDIKLNLDNATNSNVDNVRNCIVQGIYHHLSIPTMVYEYINPQKFKFDLREIRVTVE